MAGHSQYKRTTDRDAYTKGERFIAHLDYKFKAQGGLLPFLKDFAQACAKSFKNGNNPPCALNL